jgi:NAD(P)-dependent dehydrogenase (short-subunit alcohol dehydrogenase family)
VLVSEDKSRYRMKPVALITGSNRGTGRAIAQEFVDRGYEVKALNRTVDSTLGVSQIRCDVGRFDELVSAWPQLNMSAGLDVCIINAAVRRLADVEDLTVDQWDESIRTNLSGAFYLCKLALPALKSRRGMIVFVGSNSDSRPFEGGAAYAASKAGMACLARVLALEAAPFGIRTVLVTAGAIANRHKGCEEAKILTQSMAKIIADTVQSPSDCVVSEIVVNPRRGLTPLVVGIDRLLYH